MHSFHFKICKVSLTRSISCQLLFQVKVWHYQWGHLDCRVHQVCRDHLACQVKVNVEKLDQQVIKDDQVHRDNLDLLEGPVYQAQRAKLVTATIAHLLELLPAIDMNVIFCITIIFFMCNEHFSIPAVSKNFFRNKSLLFSVSLFYNELLE